MASQPKIIACGARMMLVSMAVRFIIGPALMSVPSYAVGMRGSLLGAAIVQVNHTTTTTCMLNFSALRNIMILYNQMQAAFPQGIVPFVYANEYGLHPDILSTG